MVKGSLLSSASCGELKRLEVELGAAKTGHRSTARRIETNRKSNAAGKKRTRLKKSGCALHNHAHPFNSLGSSPGTMSDFDFFLFPG
jgi:hypothetical protein